MPSSPRVEIAPGIFAESVVKRSGSGATEAHQVFRVTGGVFDQFELESLASLADLVGLLGAMQADDLRAWAEEPLSEEDGRAVQQAFAARRGRRSRRIDPGHRRVELELPASAPSAAAHRRFTCDSGAPRRARVWLAETLGDCLPDTDWSIPLLEQTVLQASDLVSEALEAGARAVLLIVELEGTRLRLTRFDEFQSGEPTPDG